MDQWASKIIRGPSPTSANIRSDIGCQFCSSEPSSKTTTLVEGVLSKPSSVIREKERQFSEDSNIVEHSRALSPYIAMIAGFFQQVLCWGLIMTFGSVLSFYARHLMPTVSKTRLAVVGAMPPMFLLSLALLWGRLLDAGHHRMLNIFAGACITLGHVGLAFTGGAGRYGDGKYWAILLATVPIGVGQSVFFLSAPHMAKTWFPKHKGFAMGITNAGAAVGGAVFPLAFTELTQHLSFRGSIGVLAGIAGIVSIFIACFSVPSPATFVRRPVANARRLKTWLPLRAFASWTLRLHMIAMCLVYLGILTIPFFIEVWARKMHLGHSEDTRKGLGINDRKGKLQVYLVVILNASQLPGRWLGSAACDKIQARKLHCISCVAAATLILPFWIHANHYRTACGFAGAFGFLSGIMVSLPINDVQDILTSKRPQLFGQYSGLVYTCASPFIFGGAIIGGALVDYVSVQAAGIWSASTFLAGAVFIAASLIVKDDTWKFDESEIPKEEMRRWSST